MVPAVALSVCGCAAGHHAEEPQSMPLTVKNPDGSVTLNSFLPEHLVAHLQETIVKRQTDLIYTQLLSDQTKTMYRERGRDPHDAVKWLLDNSNDVLSLLSRMSGGLNSPGVTWQNFGSYIQLVLASRSRGNLRFHLLDMAQENGQFRLLMIE